ncbi:hypothetical protein [Clostridium baratii]|uniref:hypothetical protein n=1 Tax=Clostridium baratii TaxID=1561 RepID=UPI00097FBD53|nr:hypothetical protein [Clostridium baratii]AQM58664.1 hypothetical protein NPD11_451 [Clostridium baratii]
MHFIKYLIIGAVATLQIATFCIAVSKYIDSSNRKDRIEYLLMALSGLIGFILFSNPVVLLY